MRPTSIFTPLPDGWWLPQAQARGPFHGVQGGLAAALMCSTVEAASEGFVASVTTHFLKPVPLEPLLVTLTPAYIGRRVSIFDAELATAKGPVAVQRATVIRPGQGDNLPLPDLQPASPGTLAADALISAHGAPWFMDTLDMRRGPDGVAWFRQTTSIVEQSSPMSRVLPPADFAHGLGPPMGCEVRPHVAIPNPDVTVHLIRAPVGDWIGVDATAAWSTAAIGAGWAALYDCEGLIGRVAMSIAITVLEGARS